MLATIDPDIVALQEVIGAGPRGPGHAETLGAALGMGWVMAPARELRRHQFGNVVLSRHPIREHAQLDLSWKTCEPRCSQRVAIESGHGLLHVFNVHLGTALLERRYQAQRLAAWVHDRRITGPKLVLGDFNEWSRGLVGGRRSPSGSKASTSIRTSSGGGRIPASSRVLHLDHIYLRGAIEVRHVNCRAHGWRSSRRTICRSSRTFGSSSSESGNREIRGIGESKGASQPRFASLSFAPFADVRLSGGARAREDCRELSRLI